MPRRDPFAEFAERVQAPLRPPPEPDDEFEERAAILEFDAGMSRLEAEMFATWLLDMSRWKHSKGFCRTVGLR